MSSEGRRRTHWERQMATRARAEEALRAVLVEQTGTWRTVAELRALLQSRGTPGNEQRLRQLLEALEAQGLVESRPTGHGWGRWWRLRQGKLGDGGEP